MVAAGDFLPRRTYLDSIHKRSLAVCDNFLGNDFCATKSIVLELNVFLDICSNSVLDELANALYGWAIYCFALLNKMFYLTRLLCDKKSTEGLVCIVLRLEQKKQTSIDF